MTKGLKVDFKLLLDYLAKFGYASREEIDQLLSEKLSDALDLVQKENKIGNLLTKLHRRGAIENKWSRKSPAWQLADKNAE